MCIQDVYLFSMFIPFCFSIHLSGCTDDHLHTSLAIEMLSCFLIGVIFGFLLLGNVKAFSSLCCPLLLCFLASGLGKVSDFRDGARTKWALPALEADRVQGSMHPDALLQN